MRSRLFQNASASLSLSLLNDEKFISSVNQVIVSTKQSHDDAMEFILTLAEVDSESLQSDKEAFKAACLEAVKLKSLDQNSLLLLVIDDERSRLRSLREALDYFYALQKVEDGVIESPGMRLISEEHHSLQDAVNRLRSHQNVEDAVIESPGMRH